MGHWRRTILLSVLFLLFFSAVIINTVEASVLIGYVARDENGKIFEYDYEELLDSYTFKILGASAKLFDDFNSKNVVAYKSSKGYFDYEDILDAYTVAILSGKTFNLKNYLDSKAKPVEFDKITYVTLGSNGKLKFTEKILDKIKINIALTNYNLTLKEMIDIQMKRSPQTDLYGGGWKNAKREDVEYYVNPNNFFDPDMLDSSSNYVVINVSASTYLRVRKEPSTSSSELTRVYKDEVYRLLDTHKTSSATWYKIEARGHTGWVHGDYVMISTNNYTTSMFQFLVLTGSAGTKRSDLGSLLKGRGILDGTERAFMEGSKQHNINEVFLVSLALHETGNGKSALATGWDYYDEESGKTIKVYNMFGIGAVDSNPNHEGAKFAYNAGWFSPEEAIIGGAKFVGEAYINNSTHQQDTLYKMRWNPANPGRHQYATDIGWALKQTSRIKSLYDQLNTYTLHFDIPQYK